MLSGIVKKQVPLGKLNLLILLVLEIRIVKSAEIISLLVFRCTLISVYRIDICNNLKSTST